MNKNSHKVIFSRSCNRYIVVCETASNVSPAGRNRNGSSALGTSLTLARDICGAVATSFAIVMSAWGAAPAPNALPKGGSVSQGKVSFNKSGNTLTLTQTTDLAVVNFTSFDIGAGAKVNIVQPSAKSVQLDRVTGNSPSQIMGQLSSNGQVVLVNPNGIVVGKDGSVSASAFTASTLGISDADFMAGNYNFKGNGSNGAVVNQGTIKVNGGNYVALLGASVTNDGQIVAQNGSVYLGAANSIAVPVSSSGKIKLVVSADAVRFIFKRAL